MSQERINMESGVKAKPEYVIDYDTFAANWETVQALIDTADVVVIGSARMEIVKVRLKEGRS